MNLGYAPADVRTWTTSELMYRLSVRRALAERQRNDADATTWMMNYLNGR